jgi:hypothetical protein
MKHARILITGAFAGAAAFLVAGLPSLGCGSDGDTTTGRRVTLAGRAASDSTAEFTNAQGWTVTLSQVAVSTGPLYYFDGETIFGTTARAPRGLDALFVRAAFAHPGHYVPGNAKGEMLTPTSFDLAKGPADLGMGQGVSGPFRSATFAFQAPPQGALATELGGAVAKLAGTATKGGESRAFTAAVAPEEVKGADGTTSIAGCPFKEADVQANGTVTLTVRLTQWFDQVDFTTLAPGAPAELPQGSLPRNQLTRGMKAASAYSFSYAP